MSYPLVYLIEILVHFFWEKRRKKKNTVVRRSDSLFLLTFVNKGYLLCKAMPIRLFWLFPIYAKILKKSAYASASVTATCHIWALPQASSLFRLYVTMMRPSPWVRMQLPQLLPSSTLRCLWWMILWLMMVAFPWPSPRWISLTSLTSRLGTHPKLPDDVHSKRVQRIGTSTHQIKRLIKAYFVRSNLSLSRWNNSNLSPRFLCLLPFQTLTGNLNG